MKDLVSIFGLVCFFVTGQIGILPVYAQDLLLPTPGVRINLSPEFNPSILKGIKVHPDNPFRFDFILDRGDRGLNNDQLKNESTKLIKYFLASLTIPETDLWVNLSPYEKNRIIPQSFGLTVMGRDLLAEDYMLKQITASLIYPEDKIGKKFWKRIYEEAVKKLGTTNVPVDTFNKVWIVPAEAIVYENAKAGTAYVVESRLKVMLEQDYLSLEKHLGIQGKVVQDKDTSKLACQIIREIVIPELTKEVNEGRNFAQLRQVYNSLILATWYKKKIKDSILAQVYADRNRVNGVGYLKKDGDIGFIYQRYLQAFKKGVYNYIKEEIDPATQQTIPRKYFSGGLLLDMDSIFHPVNTMSRSRLRAKGNYQVTIDLAMVLSAAGSTSADEAMAAAPSYFVQRSTSEDRNQDVIRLLVSGWFQKKSGLDLRKGPYLIVNVGAGAYPFDSLELEEALKKMKNPLIQVMDTELPHSTPLAHVHDDSVLMGDAFKEYLIETGIMGLGDPSRINDVFLMVNRDYQPTELVVGYKNREKLLGDKKKVIRQFYTTIGINPKMKSINYRKKFDDAFFSVYQKALEALGEHGFNVDQLKGMIEGTTAYDLHSIRIEKGPLENLLRSRGIEFLASDDLGKSISNASVIMANNVLLHWPLKDQEILKNRWAEALKQGGLLITKNKYRTGSRVVVYQKRQEKLVPIGDVWRGPFSNALRATGVLETEMDNFIVKQIKRAFQNPRPSRTDQAMLSKDKQRAISYYAAKGEITQGLTFSDPYKNGGPGSNYESVSSIMGHGYLTGSGKRVIEAKVNQYGLVMVNSNIHPNTIMTAQGYLTGTGIAVLARDNETGRTDFGLAHVLNADENGNLLGLLLNTQKDLSDHRYTAMEYIVSYYPPMFKKDMNFRDSKTYELQVRQQFQKDHAGVKVRFLDRGWGNVMDTGIGVDNQGVTIKPFLYPGRIFNWKKESSPSQRSDEAMMNPMGLPKGGVDLTPSRMNLQTKTGPGLPGGNNSIQFHLDPATLRRLQNASGFVPVIVNIQPMTNLSQFLND